MIQEGMVYVGIDISKETFNAAVLQERGKVRHHQFRNTSDGFQKLIEWLVPYEMACLHVCMEGTGRLWEQLAEFLYSFHLKVSVVNPAQVKGFAESEMRRSKTDRLDAAIIARFCKSQSPVAWKAPTPDRKLLRDLQRHLTSLKEDKTRQTNRAKSGVLNQLIAEGIKRNMEHIQSEIDFYEKQIKSLIAKNESMQAARQVMSIVGVGQALAAAFVGEIGPLERFQTSRDVEIFCGLTPRVYESGSSVRGKTRISKKGNSHIRRLLFMASLSAMKHNPQLRTFADRLKQKDKPGKVVVCAVARKLLRMMVAVIRSGQDYDPNFKSKRLTVA